MLDDDNDFDAEPDERSWLQRHMVPVVGAMVLVVGVASAVVLLKGGSGPAPRPRNEPHITQVQLPPPPPPPPPPKTPPPPKKLEDTPKQREPTPTKPTAAAKPAPKAPAPPASVTTSIAGPGNSGLAVGNNGGGDTLGTGNGEGGGGDNDAYYSNLVQSRLQDLLRRDRKLEFSKYHLVISFNLDASGAASGLAIAAFTGSEEDRAEVEHVIREFTTGDTPPSTEVGKKFTVRIDERARG